MKCDVLADDPDVVCIAGVCMKTEQETFVRWGGYNYSLLYRNKTQILVGKQTVNYRKTVWP